MTVFLNSPRRAWGFGASLAATLVAIACSGDGPTGPDPDHSAPTVTVTTPVSGARIESDRVDVTVGLTDDRGLARVGYLLNGAAGDSASVQGTSATHTFHVQGLRDGENVIAIVARDAAGNVSHPHSVVVTRQPADEVAPVVVITSPAAGSALRDDSLVVRGRASDAVGVRVIRWQLNGGAYDSVAVSDTGASFSATIRELTGGVNVVRVEAIDAAGNAGESQVSVVHDRVAPELTVDTPADSSVVLVDSVVVRGTVIDTATRVASLTIQRDANDPVAITIDSVGGFTTTVRGFAEGPVMLTVTATDAAGNVATTVRHLTYRIPASACAMPEGYTKAWVGATNEWSVPQNWSPAGVPTAEDDVFVCAGAGFDPAMAGYAENAAVRSLGVAAGAALDLNGNELTVHGNLDARGAIIGGSITMAGQNVTVRGTLPALLIAGRVAATDTVLVTRDLGAGSALEPFPSLDVGRAYVRVDGTLFLGFGLVMRDDAGVLDARGGLYTRGSWASDAPMMAYRDSVTAGTIRVAGAFRSEPRSIYRPRGTHTIVFDDTVAQDAGVYTEDYTTPFNHVEVRNAAGVRFSTDVRIDGRLRMIGDGVLLQDTTWATIYTTSLPVTSAGYRVMRTMAGPSLRLDADADLQLPAGGRLEISCGICENNSRLEIGPHRLTVRGELYAWLGNIVMADPAGYVDVQGDVRWAGAYAADSLLTGTMRVTGNLTAEHGIWGQYVYRPRPAHTLVLDGTAVQQVAFADPYPGHQHLPTVEVRNAAGVQLDTTTYIVGQLRMVGNGRLFLKDATDTVRHFALDREWSHVPASAPGTPFPITSAGYQVANSGFVGHWVIEGDRTFHMPAGGTMTLGVPSFGSADLRVAQGSTLLVQGDLYALNGQVYTRTDDAILNVRGSVTIANAFGADSMTAGALHVGGNFTQLGPDLNWGFQPGGTHTTVFDGTAPQQVEINGATSMTTRRFQNLRIAVGADVRFTTNARVAGSTDVFGKLGVASGTTLGTEHAIYLRSGGTIDNAGAMFCNHTYTRGTSATLVGLAPTCNGGQGTLRIRLSWADPALNLDGHLTGPAVDGSTGTFVVNPAQPTYSHDGAEFTHINTVFSDLVTGPEIIESFTTAGRYRYQVKLAPASAGSLAASGATVIVESFQDLGDRIEVKPLGQFTLPAGFSGDTWTVFELENRTLLPQP